MSPRIAVPIVACFLCAAVSAQVTQRVSVSSSGAQGDGYSFNPSSSADVRYVAFDSSATNLVPGDTNSVSDVFVYDRAAGTTERVSLATNGAEANGYSAYPSISGDGRFVAFISGATNLVNGDTNAWPDVFVRDRQTGTTERVNVGSGGAQANNVTWYATISADGRYVAFVSNASNLVPGDTDGYRDLFVYDRLAGRTELVSIASNGTQGNTDMSASPPSISADGRYVAFWSRASNLVPGDTNGVEDIFVRDRQNGTTERVSINSFGVQGNGPSALPSISADGRYVAFESFSTNLVAGDTNGAIDVFLHDRQSGATERVSVPSGGGQANNDCLAASISADGRFVAFESNATNLVPGELYFFFDVFIRDRFTGTTERVSITSGGTLGNGNSYTASISADGRFVAFGSAADNLVSGDTNGATDIFVRDRDAAGFTSTCHPEMDGVRACPCSNPPSAFKRGCDNSATTGGATLSASGIAYLSSDSLVFTSSGEKPTALSIVMQGNSVISGGVVYGQGVRCLGGTIIRRLFIKQAIAGSITAPDFGAGDPTVSARSTAKGDVIQPGQSRWYLVYYRDPIVLGGCPASSTFNATQTGRVDWSP